MSAASTVSRRLLFGAGTIIMRVSLTGQGTQVNLVEMPGPLNEVERRNTMPFESRVFIAILLYTVISLVRDVYVAFRFFRKSNKVNSPAMTVSTADASTITIEPTNNSFRCINPNEDTIWITKYGTKAHRVSNCGSTNPATAMSYPLCKNCIPVTVEAEVLSGGDPRPTSSTTANEPVQSTTANEPVQTPMRVPIRNETTYIPRWMLVVFAITFFLKDEIKSVINYWLESAGYNPVANAGIFESRWSTAPG
jgi:hypothetical protein